MNPLLENVRADDFVEYFIYPSGGNSCSIAEIYNKISSFVSQWTENYFWHKDKFNLTKVTNIQSDDDSSYLHGVTHFGENIDDEWFVVYLIKKISENFDIIARVTDVDGEFLLIEAADHLSKWMKSDNCDGRVYFHAGTVKVLPLNVLPKTTNIKQIVTYLKNSHQVTDTEKNITICINSRIKRHFENLEDLLHRSRVYLPAKIAALLDAQPKLISHAVTAFFNRDMIDSRVCRKMEHFPPKDLVLRLITFTKFSYAMISHDKSNPERNRWSLPPPTDTRYKEHLLGYKIAGGFEILAAKCDKKSQSDLTLSKKWNQYLQVLKRKGYFKDLIEQSKEYINLEKKARMYFLDNVGIEESNDNGILNIFQTIKYNVEEMKRDEATIPESDDEKWMQVNEDIFNKLLEDRFGMPGVNVTSAPNALSTAINKFLHQMSDMDGIEIKNDKNASQEGEMDVDEETSQNVSFEPDNFMASVQKILEELNEGIDTNENSNKDSEDSDEDEDTLEDPEMKSYMDLMDKEVAKSTLSKSFVTKPDKELLDPVDIGANAMANFLQSYEEQFGGSGPTGNFLHSIGLKVDVKKSQ